MTRQRARFVTACQQLLALGVVLAVLTPAASVVTLDVVSGGPHARGTLARPVATEAAYSAEAVQASKVPAAPVHAKVREVQLTAPTALAGRPALGTPAARVSPVDHEGAQQLISRPQVVTGFGEVGVTWSHGTDVPQQDAAFAVRTRTAGAWSSWQQLTYDPEHAPDPNSAEGKHARPGTDPLLVGKVDDVQVRAVTDRPLPADMKLAVIDPGTATSTTTQRAAIDTSTLDGGTGQDSVYRSTEPATSDATASNATASLAAAVYTPEPVIYSRAQWGADESMRDKSSLHYYEVHAGFVHHTVNANDYSRAEVPGLIRSIYAYHVRSRGWSDIGYNFLVDRFGRIWEGRYGGVDRPVVGAHTLNYNDYAFAMSAIGNYDIHRPSKAMIQAYGTLFAWKLSLHGVDAASTHQQVGSTVFQAINGHRDAAATACPGRYLYAKLPLIRRLAAADQRGWAGRQLESNLASTPAPDIVVRRASDGEAFVLPTGGLTRFEAPRPAATGVSGARQVVTSRDLTGDGRSDLVVHNADGTVSIRPGNRTGGFGAAVGAPLRSFRGKNQITALGDLNGDHHNDLAARNPSSGRLIVWLGAGDGTFNRHRLNNSWNRFNLITGTGDLTGDGIPDIVARKRSGALWLMPGNGRTGFRGAVAVPGNWSRYDVIAGGGDYNGDGRSDLFVRSASNGAAWVLPGNGHGGFSHALGPVARFAHASRLTSGASLSGTSAPDPVAVQGDTVVRYDNSGTFDLGRAIDTGRIFTGVDKILRVGDWNRDGYGDVVTRIHKSGNLYLYLGNGTGRLGAPTRLAKGFRGINLLAAVGDMTGDGYPDLMGQPTGLAMRIYPGKGSAGFKSSYPAYGRVTAGRQIGVGRWDADGAPDSLMRTGRRLKLYPGNGPGGLTSPRPVTANLKAFDWTLGISDLNLTGHPDVIVRQKSTGYLWVLRGKVHGFAPRRFLGEGMKAYDLAG